MNADRIARIYERLERAAFGSALEQARFHYLREAAEARRVLILGEGDGRFLARLLESNRHASIVVVEMSERMIELAGQRLPIAERSRVEFYQIDATAHSLPDDPFDLAVTHFFFDTLSCCDAGGIINKVSALLAPGASWLISEFQVPAAGLRRLHARLWLRAMYIFFSTTTALHVSELPPYRKMLEDHGLTEVCYRESRFGLIRSQLWRKCADGL